MQPCKSLQTALALEAKSAVGLKVSAARILKRENETGQLWAGVSIESPHYQEDRGKQLDSVFHWIGTYRRNADIFWPYGNYKAFNTTHFQKQAIHQNLG